MQDSYKFYKDSNGHFRHRGDSNSWVGILKKNMLLDDLCYHSNLGYASSHVYIKQTSNIITRETRQTKYANSWIQYCDFEFNQNDKNKRRKKITMSSHNSKKNHKRFYDYERKILFHDNNVADDNVNAEQMDDDNINEYNNYDDYVYYDDDTYYDLHDKPCRCRSRHNINRHDDHDDDYVYADDYYQLLDDIWYEYRESR